MTTPAAPRQPTPLEHPPVALAFQRVSMIYPDGTEALREVALAVREGEFVSIVGPSGCGKSTLLRLAAGLLTPSSGQVVRQDARIGYTFQDPTLLPWRTVQGNVEVLLELQGLPKAERARIARAQLARMGLSGFEHHYPKQLSGGMKMRVSLARALALKPALFLFDEPFAALDEITRERLNDELQQLFIQERFAGLFITHSIAEALYLSQRLLVMSARPGRFIAEFNVPFSYPRPVELRYSPAFAELAGRVSQALRRAIEEG